MERRRIILLGVAAAMIIFAIYFFATPVSWVLMMAGEEVVPSRISWDGKNAWARCESAIAGRSSWPDTPERACAAMHLCANEAPLSEQQVEALTRKIRDTPGCQAP